jgi:transcription elongation factor GreA
MIMLTSQIQYLTQDGLQDLETRLDFLRDVRRPEIAARLHQVVESRNDLTENAAYADAKREQALVEGEIQRLEAILSNAAIIDNSSPPDVVGLGDNVRVQEKGQKHAETFQIVGTAESNPAEGRISNESPLGRALLGHRTGEQVVVDAPEGKLVFAIKAIFV